MSAGGAGTLCSAPDKPTHSAGSSPKRQILEGAIKSWAEIYGNHVPACQERIFISTIQGGFRLMQENLLTHLIS